MDRAEDARRARLVLLLAEGQTWDEVTERIECSRGFVASWSKRFSEQRVAGLFSRHLGQVATVLTPEWEARILEATRRAPSDGSTQWRTRKLAGHLDVSHVMGVFTSVADLKRKLMRYVRQDNKAPRTVKWKYADQYRISCYGPLVLNLRQCRALNTVNRVRAHSAGPSSRDCPLEKYVTPFVFLALRGRSAPENDSIRDASYRRAPT